MSILHVTVPKRMDVLLKGRHLALKFIRLLILYCFICIFNNAANFFA